MPSFVLCLIIIHRYNSFTRQLKGPYCLILDWFNTSFNLNFAVSSLRRNDNFYFQTFSTRMFATSFTITCFVSTPILSFCRHSSKSHIVWSISRWISTHGFVSSILHWRHLIFYSLLIFEDCFWLFWGKFLDFASRYLNFIARLLINSKNITGKN